MIAMSVQTESFQLVTAFRLLLVHFAPVTMRNDITLFSRYAGFSSLSYFHKKSTQKPWETIVWTFYAAAFIFTLIPFLFVTTSLVIYFFSLVFPSSLQVFPSDKFCWELFIFRSRLNWLINNYLRQHVKSSGFDKSKVLLREKLLHSLITSNDMCK